MERNGVQGIGGWLLVYTIGSIPFMLFHSAGLSGWFFDYPIPLMVVIFVALAMADAAVESALAAQDEPDADLWAFRSPAATGARLTKRQWPRPGDGRPAAPRYRRSAVAASR